jgi:hypothetical protein
LGGGGVGQKFPNDEATKVFAIRKMKKQFINKNTHILRTDVFQKHAVQEHAVLFFYWRAENESRMPEEIFKFRVSEMPFPGLWGILTEF